MKKIITNTFIALLLMTAAQKLSAQTFIFPDVLTDNPCYDGSSYVLKSGVKITGVKIVTIYNDNGNINDVTSNSFAYEIIFTYANIFTGTVNSTGNFYDYTVTMYTTNVNAGGTITNNGSNIPLVTDTTGDMNLHNNPAFHGSASAMGLQVNTTYTNPDTIALFGYDSVTLVAHAPCLSVNVGGNASIGNAPLAISLSDFSAALLENETVAINWVTRSESANEGFMVEKSTDGKHWTDLVWIASKALGGNSIMPLQYNAQDKMAANGINYYRLLQIGVNGNKTYSKVATVLNTTNNKNVVVYPNPGTGIIHIANKTGFSDEAFTLTNITGQILYKGIANGNNAYINVTDLVNGVYILQIGANQQKVIVSH